MIRNLIMLLTIVGLSFLISGCGGAKLTPEAAKAFENKSKMYTTKNMHYNLSRGTNVVDTTNYQIGTLIPVNSEVTMQNADAKQIVFLYNEETIVLRNTPKYSGLNISEVLAEYFSEKKSDLSKFSAKELKAIETASVTKGMSKDAVLISLGNPPQHRTPSLESDTWTYWRNRWTTFLVTFENSKATSDIAPAQ